MTIAQRIVAYNELANEHEASSRDYANLLPDEYKRATDIFWRMAGSIFEYDSGPNGNRAHGVKIPAENHIAFLAAVKTVLQTRNPIPEETTAGAGSDRRVYYIIAYVLRNYQHLPPASQSGLTSALRAADGPVFSISRMLSWVYSRSPSLTGGIREPTSFWDKLEQLDVNANTVP